MLGQHHVQCFGQPPDIWGAVRMVDDAREKGAAGDSPQGRRLRFLLSRRQAAPVPAAAEPASSTDGDAPRPACRRPPDGLLTCYSGRQGWWRSPDAFRRKPLEQKQRKVPSDYISGLEAWLNGGPRP